ncbi:MAG: metal ABC transporter ATP-binding protein [Nocardioidaceae bacterium]|nr:metal ABC transporter ATP-binding protein [Nocardioidaceae bacterium]
MSLPTALRADDIDVSLAGRPVVRGVELTVRPGEFVTLLGANGSGKSTVVRACVGLLPCESGSVHLFDTTLDRYDRWDRIGFVPQRSGAASGVPATVSEVVVSGRLGRRRLFGWPTGSDRRAAGERLAQVGLADRATAAVSQLSGGQQQRVLIARALVGDPDLLVMDEPVAGVDAGSQAALAEVFAGLVADGTAVLLVAHELGPLASLVDRVVLLREGRVAYAGAPTGLPAADAGDSDHHPHGDPAPVRPRGLPSQGPWR